MCFTGSESEGRMEGGGGDEEGGGEEEVTAGVIGEEETWRAAEVREGIN